jgi:hypothetical protein
VLRVRQQGVPISAACVLIPAETLALTTLLQHFPKWSDSCNLAPRKAVNLAQRTIEMLIGRLITDEQFRFEFLQDPQRTLVAQCDLGLELSRTEMAALVETDPALWTRTADAVDPRLQKASLKNPNPIRRK